ncbi:MAG TPA: NIPSNAP family protein, partial [Longimicrobiales bacterium]|nr:NIPSNAP family protein [Longimicrobiales bacterium]
GYGIGFRAGAGDLVPEARAATAPTPQAADRVFELRTYTAPEGKLDDLLARFRNHTMRIFEKHGMTNVGYWLPQDEELRQNTLVYLLAHPSRAAADQAWRDFSADPEWQRVSEESQRDGRIVSGVERMYLDPTDFSQMR